MTRPEAIGSPQEARAARLDRRRADNHLLLRDGRLLSYARWGHPGGWPVIYAHGVPASRLEAEILDAAARRLELEILAPDRPGLGRSDFQPDRRITDWPDDVAELASALRIERFSVLGVSGGCPYALACARQMPRRVARLAIVAGIGPTDEGAAIRRMGLVARSAFALSRRAPALFALAYGGLARLVARHPDLNFRLNRPSRPDRAVLGRREVAATLRRSVREALRQGPRGAVHDLTLLGRPWGFSPEELRQACDIWHGRQDGTVPWQMGARLAGRMPGARFHRLDGEGHLSLAVRHRARILRALVPEEGRRIRDAAEA